MHRFGLRASAIHVAPEMAPNEFTDALHCDGIACKFRSARLQQPVTHGDAQVHVSLPSRWWGSGFRRGGRHRGAGHGT